MHPHAILASLETYQLLQDSLLGSEACIMGRYQQMINQDNLFSHSRGSQQIIVKDVFLKETDSQNTKYQMQINFQVDMANEIRRSYASTTNNHPCKQGKMQTDSEP
jgi:hypothetical protein